MAKGPRSGDLTSEDRRLWTRVAGSVTPPRKRKAVRVTPDAAAPSDPAFSAPTPPALKAPPRPRASTSIAVAPVSTPVRPALGPRTPKPAPDALEPRRHRRLARERDPIEARIDLHGLGRYQAEDELRAFLSSAQARGLRAVLVITGQGRMGGGVIRASAAEWLQAPGLRGVVAGFSVAHRRHGGDGAIYVTLKRRG